MGRLNLSMGEWRNSGDPSNSDNGEIFDSTSKIKSSLEEM